MFWVRSLPTVAGVGVKLSSPSTIRTQLYVCFVASICSNWSYGCMNAETNYPWNWTRQISLRCFFQFSFCAYQLFTVEPHLFINSMWIMNHFHAARDHMNTYASIRALTALLLFSIFIYIVDTVRMMACHMKHMDRHTLAAILKHF